MRSRTTSTFPFDTRAASVPNVNPGARRAYRAVVVIKRYTKVMEQCLIDGCPRPAVATGRCHSHYEYRRRNGTDRGPFPASFTERFWSKVAKGDAHDCWLWTAATDGSGRYGAIYRDGRLQRAHRVAYELLRGPIPDELVVDHLCRVTLCVNPSHLDLVDQRTNIMRGSCPTAVNAAKTHCKRGHEFTPENTRNMKSGGRACLTCEVEYHRPRSRERAKAKRIG